MNEQHWIMQTHWEVVEEKIAIDRSPYDVIIPVPAESFS
jgi:hypothetical protein